MTQRMRERYRPPESFAPYADSLLALSYSQTCYYIYDILSTPVPGVYVLAGANLDPAASSSAVTCENTRQIVLVH